MPSEEILSRDRIKRIEELILRAEALPDLAAKSLLIELLQSVMELHAAGIDRMLEIVAAAGPAGERIVELMAADRVSSSVLLLHGLHPDDLQTRVGRAVEKLRLRFGPRGGTLSLVGFEDGVVHLRYESASQRSVDPEKETIEDALYEAAPEVEGVVIEGLRKPPVAGFVPVADLLAGQPA
jgi:hypothetical protein